jgi:hypothetical protein
MTAQRIILTKLLLPELAIQRSRKRKIDLLTSDLKHKMRETA